MKTKILLLLLALTVSPVPVQAASRTVTLDVHNMTCAVCPITVKKALERVNGVQQVTVDYPSKTATVQFDDTATTVDALTKATADAGYPSAIKGAKNE